MTGIDDLNFSHGQRLTADDLNTIVNSVKNAKSEVERNTERIRLLNSINSTLETVNSKTQSIKVPSGVYDYAELVKVGARSMVTPSGMKFSQPKQVRSIKKNLIQTATRKSTVSIGQHYTEYPLYFDWKPNTEYTFYCKYQITKCEDTYFTNNNSIILEFGYGHDTFRAGLASLKGGTARWHKNITSEDVGKVNEIRLTWTTGNNADFTAMGNGLKTPCPAAWWRPICVGNGKPSSGVISVSLFDLTLVYGTDETLTYIPYEETIIDIPSIPENYGAGVSISDLEYNYLDWSSSTPTWHQVADTISVSANNEQWAVYGESYNNDNAQYPCFYINILDPSLRLANTPCLVSHPFTYIDVDNKGAEPIYKGTYGGYAAWMNARQSDAGYLYVTIPITDIMKQFEGEKTWADSKAFYQDDEWKTNLLVGFKRLLNKLPNQKIVVNYKLKTPKTLELLSNVNNFIRLNKDGEIVFTAVNDRTVTGSYSTIEFQKI